ncbi:TonB-linked outer membrane protein, SusC/RagA family [Algoriphagus faecimaris]|uniref:TonB-linked outer membrane protein, SusC/RagA family n=1 Tax=Algoriphagus faecimaris TaxID=686796 RepID=A0A1G6M945_9BACT|nr:TonB-dependent receptor [Algoriphagus faecimaris]SDC52019.1 TonB-linked outer membrane protein, SusC/RagA family [Algoriphagus faecimaris]
MRKVLLLGLMLILGSAVAFAQSRVVTGTVISSEDNLPIPGATVLVKGTTIGTATDLDGRFSISVPSGSDVLVVSFVGSTSKEISIGNRSELDVILDPDTKLLGEVVITGYSVQTKREVTGAVSQVRGDVIENLPMQSFDRALQGRAAGVQVASANGIPGGAVNIRIRGVGSVNAGNEPLYIVDGVQLNSRDDAGFTQSNPLAFLNPNDIESMEILKDAATAAIYGAQAANGVVIITTKKGKAGKAQFTFNAYGGTTEPLKTLDVTNATEVYQLRKEAYINAGINIPQARGLNDLGVLPSNWQSLSVEELDQIGADLPFYDWQREALITGKIQNYELSASGGDEKTTFFISGSYNSQEATVSPVNFERGTFAVKLGHKATNRLNIETNLNLSTFGQNTPFATSGAFLGNPAFSAATVLPHNPIYNEDGSFNENIRGILNQNVIAVNTYNSGIQRTNQVVGNIAATYQLADNLIFRSLFGVDYRLVQAEDYTDPRTPDGRGVNGRGQVQSNWNVNFITTQTLNYNKTINSVHNISGVYGVEYRSETNQGISGSGTGFPTFQFRTVQSAAIPENITSFWTGFKRFGTFLQANYDYNKKYLLTLTGRYDGSSRFGADNLYGFFPSVRAGWYLKEEGFLKESTTISELKLRASWGVTGNDQIGNFDSRGLYIGTGTYNGGGGIRPSGLANEQLSWEKNETINIGVDFGLFDNRVSGALDVFNRNSKDLLFPQPILWTNGFGSVTRNVGSLVNRGIEFEIRTVNVNTNNFRWDTDFNITRIENEITSLYDGLEELPSNPAIRVGESLGSYFSYEYAGVNPATGRPMWYDIDGNLKYQVQAGDRKILGNSLPSWYGGMNNTFSYKGLELTVFFQYEYGRLVPDGQVGFMRENASRLTLNALKQTYDARWTEPGQMTYQPRVYSGGTEVRASGMNTGGASLFNADYIRLKQVSLSYNLSPSLLSKIGLTRAKVYAQGVNLWTYAPDYPGYDPEFLGAATGIIPQTRNYTVGIQVGF